MKQGPPSAPPEPLPSATQTFELKPTVVEPARQDEPSNYDDKREQADRNRRKAEPDYQDGSYGFEAKDNEMEVDSEAPVPLGATPSAPRQPNREYDRRDGRYGPPPRTYGTRYDERDRGYGRPRDDRRLYGDNMFSRNGGRYR